MNYTPIAHVEETKIVADVICKLSLDNESAGVLQPHFLDRLRVRDALLLLHRRGNQLRNADRSLASSLQPKCLIMMFQ